MAGIGSVNHVRRATSAYGAARHEYSQLRADLTAANNVVSELWADNQDNMSQIRAMAGMFNLIMETTSVLAREWRNVRLNINCDPTPEERAELERQTENRTSKLFDDLNL